MRILILGGTGFIGSRVVAALAGNDIMLFHQKAGGIERSGVRHLLGDRRWIGEFRSEFRAFCPDVVLDMNAQNSLDARATLSALAEFAGRFVMISSLSVYRSFGVLLGIETAPVDSTLLTEDAPLRRRLFPYRGESPRPASDPKQWFDDYDKIPAEMAFLSCSEPGCSILRLPMVYGSNDPDRRIAAYLDRMANGATIRLAQKAANWRNSRVHVENAAAAVACVVAGGVPGRIYNLAEPEDWTEAEWIRRIGLYAGWTGRLEVVSNSVAAGRPLIDEFPVNANFAQHLCADSKRIRHELGYTEVVLPDDGLRLSIREILTDALQN